MGRTTGEQLTSSRGVGEEEKEEEEEGEQRVREPPATTGISLSLLFFTDNADAGHFYDDQAGGNHIPDKRL